MTRYELAFDVQLKELGWHLTHQYTGVLSYASTCHRPSCKMVGSICLTKLVIPLTLSVIFGLHSTMAEQLREYGFRGEEAGLEADFVDVDHGFRTASETVNWLELVDVAPLIDGLKPFQARKLKKSGVYDVATFDDRVVTKGTHVDWPPLIGKIY